jgi:hypothetical protein
VLLTFLVSLRRFAPKLISIAKNEDLQTISQHPKAQVLDATAFLQPNTSAFLSEMKCYQSWIDWRSSTSKLDSLMINFPKQTITQVETRYFETTKTIREGTFYTECDNIARFRPDLAANASVSISTFSLEYTGYDEFHYRTDLQGHLTYPFTPGDVCEVSEATCFRLWEEYKVKIQQNSSLDLIDPLAAAPCELKPIINLRDCLLDLRQEVVLLYWPPEIENRDICLDSSDPFAKWRTRSSPTTGAPRSIVTDAITFKGQDLYLLNRTIAAPIADGILSTWVAFDPMVETRSSVMYGNFTFVSPYIYIAHHPITASISSINRSGPGALRDPFGRFLPVFRTTQTVAPSGIIMIDPKDIMSAQIPIVASQPWQTLEYVRSLAMGRYEDLPLSVRFGLAYSPFQPMKRPLNLADLMDPVPASVYYNGREDCWESNHIVESSKMAAIDLGCI